MDAGCTLDLG